MTCVTVFENLALQVAEFENCKVLLVDKKISTARDIVGILEAAVRGSFSLLIMAEDIEQEALATMVVNKLRGTLKVRTPSNDERPADNLALFTLTL